MSINKLFEEKIQEIPNEIKSIRNRILGEIEAILEKCRKTISWDDRSELKLYQWLNNRSETNLYTSKLSELF